MYSMKNKKIINTNFELCSIRIDELDKIVTPWELAVLLSQESHTSQTDIMLSNMLEYYVDEEKYEYACVIRDEIRLRNI